MQLKNVVLPAPLGPMTLTMEFGSISKSRLFTASSPPKRLVTFWALRRAISSALPRGNRAARDGALGLDVLLLDVQLALYRTRRQQPLRPEAHHQDQRAAVEQQAVLGELAEQLGQA